MMFPAEQAFVGRDEKRASLKTSAWEASAWENSSKVLFRRVLKNAEMSEVKQWLMSIGIPGIETLRIGG